MGASGFDLIVCQNPIHSGYMELDLHRHSATARGIAREQLKGHGAKQLGIAVAALSHKTKIHTRNQRCRRLQRVRSTLLYRSTDRQQSAMTCHSPSLVARKASDIKHCHSFLAL
ncbi:MAG: hypothetical protein ACI8W7_003474 [Gammaproteobacteria bacterium]|jgi:hypothetical protein